METQINSITIALKRFLNISYARRIDCERQNNREIYKFITSLLFYGWTANKDTGGC